jgi:hypothetical protein
MVPHSEALPAIEVAGKMVGGSGAPGRASMRAPHSAPSATARSTGSPAASANVSAAANASPAPQSCGSPASATASQLPSDSPHLAYAAEIGSEPTRQFDLKMASELLEHLARPTTN